jgi:hypothetical protein
MTDETKSVPAQSPDDDELIGLNARLADALAEIRHLKAALSGNAQGHGLTAEDVYVNCQTTLMGFEAQLDEQTRHFICDQISRKVMLALSGNAGADNDATTINNRLSDLPGNAGAVEAQKPVDITGWKLVPDQPTEAMWQAGRSADIHPGDSYSKVWAAMFDAAPNVDDCETVSRAAPLPATQGDGE